VLLTALAGRLGALRKGGEPDMDATLAFLLRHFREGRMGRWTLDDVDGAEAEYVARVTGKTEAEAVEETEDERAPAPPAYEVAALGAVGTGGTSISENAASASSAHSPASTALEQRVDATVQRFLAQVAEERADTEAGRNLSKAQIAKGERQAKIEARKAKALAKGYNIDNKGSKGSKGKGRGRR
jgi:hypothetical protein